MISTIIQWVLAIIVTIVFIVFVAGWAFYKYMQDNLWI